jgi:hypothetical protein
MSLGRLPITVLLAGTSLAATRLNALGMVAKLGKREVEALISNGTGRKTVYPQRQIDQE